MKNLKLFLLEDNIEEAIETSSFLKSNGYEVTTADTVEKAKEILIGKVFDIIILDIMIHGKPDGIMIARFLNNQKIDTPFLFLTSMHTRHFFEAAKLTLPLTYLLKPYNTIELLFSLELALENFYLQKNTLSLEHSNGILSQECLFIKKNRSVMKVNIENIHYVEVKEKYCSISSDEGNFIIKLSLKKIKEHLNNFHFFQVHRNFLLNLKKVKEVYLEDNLIILTSNSKIPLSERHKSSFAKAFTILR